MFWNRGGDPTGQLLTEAENLLRDLRVAALDVRLAASETRAAAAELRRTVNGYSNGHDNDA